MAGVYGSTEEIKARGQVIVGLHWRIRGEQQIIVRYEPEKAIQTLPALLGQRTERDRLLTLLDRLMADKRVQALGPSSEQMEMLKRIRAVLGAPGGRCPRGAAAG